MEGECVSYYTCVYIAKVLIIYQFTSCRMCGAAELVYDSYCFAELISRLLGDMVVSEMQ